MLNFAFLLVRAVLLVVVLTASSQAWADCGAAKVSRAMRAGNTLLEGPADDATQVPKLEAAHADLTEQVNFAKAKQQQNPDLCAGAPVAQGAALAQRLRDRITKLNALGNQVRLKVVTELEGAQAEDVRDLWLDGKLIARSGTQVVSGGAHEFAIEFLTSQTRNLTFTVHVDGQLVPDRELERADTKRVYRLPSMSPGDHDLVLTVTGKEPPKGRFLEISLAEGSSTVPVKLSIEDVPYDLSRRIRLPEGEKLKLTLKHPARETGNSWFRVGATLASGTGIPKEIEPSVTQSTKTYYELQAAPGSNNLQLQLVAGPKKSPARAPMIWGGLALTVVGAGFAVIEAVQYGKLNNKGIDIGEKCEQNDGGCTQAELDSIKDTWKDADFAKTLAIVGASAGGVGLVIAGIGFFLLESGETPPKDLARGLKFPNFASLEVVPLVSVAGAGASATMKW